MFLVSSCETCLNEGVVALMGRQLGPCYECLVVNSVPNVVICRVFVLFGLSVMFTLC
jgi:hypothetical protein